MKSNKALILCIARGENYDAGMARQPALVRAIKTEMVDLKCIVRVELMEIHEFSEKHPDIRSKTSKSTKENDEPKGGKGGKKTQDGKGKDHQSSPPSRQTLSQTKSIRSDYCLHNAVVFPLPNAC